MSIPTGMPTPPEKKTNVRWWIFLLMLFIVSINYIDRSSLSIALPLITKDLHLSPETNGLIMSAFFWTYAIMQVPSGYLADKLKPRKAIAGSTIGWGLAEALTALATSGGGLIFLRMLLGIFEAPVYPASGKLQAHWLTKTERGRGATIIDAGAPLGTALGGIIIVALISWLGSWRAAFVAAGVLTVVFGLLAAWFIRNNPADHPLIGKSEVEYLTTALELEENEVSKNTNRKNLFKYMRYKSFWTMCLGWFGFDFVFYGILSWLPFYLNNVRHISFSITGTSVFIVFGAGAVGEILCGLIADYWLNKGASRNTVMRTLMGIAGMITTVAVFAIAYVPSASSAIALFSVVLFFLRWGGLYWSVPSTLTDKENVGMLGGTMNFVGNVAGIIAPILVGAIVGATGSFFFALMIFAANALLWFISSVLMDYKKIPLGDVN